jgi:hypothetical protein
MKDKILCRSLLTTEWKILTGKSSDRWKILTSPCKMCNVADVIDLVEGVQKPRIHSLCNVESFCTCRATDCFTRGPYFGLVDEGIIRHFLAGRASSRLQSIQTNSRASHLFNLL